MRGKGSGTNPNSLTAGLKNMSKPGMTNNPGGQPARKPLTDALRKLAEQEDLSEKDLKKKPSDTIAMAMAKAMVRKALTGDRGAFTEFADRVEGKVLQRHQHGGDPAEDGQPPTPIPVSAEVHARVRSIIERLRDRQAKGAGFG